MRNRLFPLLKDDYRFEDGILTGIDGKRILITGGSGLIGINIALMINHYCTKGATVSIDLGYNRNRRDFFLNGDKLSPRLDIQWKFLDLVGKDFSVESTERYDIIIHAAGYAQPGLFNSYRVESLLINTYATSCLHKSLKDGGMMIYLSSYQVYSRDDGMTSSSEDEVGNIRLDASRAAYIEGKRCGEVICHSWRNNGINTKVMRLSDIYGPGTDKFDKRAVNQFIEAGLLKGSITLRDRGTSIRNFLYVTDACEMILKAAFLGNHATYNISSGERVSIFQIALIISKLLGVKLSVPDLDEEFVSDASSYLHCSMNRFQAEFSKTELISLDSGLKRTIEWQKSLYDGFGSTR